MHKRQESTPKTPPKGVSKHHHPVLRSASMQKREILVAERLVRVGVIQAVLDVARCATTGGVGGGWGGGEEGERDVYVSGARATLHARGGALH